MKFKTVVGNPPYHLINTNVINDNEGQDKILPIYNLFIFDIKRYAKTYMTLIIPAKWYNGGIGLNEFRKEMLEDDEIKELHDFDNSEDCFSEVEIKGGVCYFIWKKNCHFSFCKVVSHREGNSVIENKRKLKTNGADVFIRYSEAISIFNKVKDKMDVSFSTLVSLRNPFGIGTKFKSVDSKDFIDGYVKIYCKDMIGYIKPEKITKGKDKVGGNKWKVYISKAYGAGNGFPHQIINKPFIGEPNSICTETYLVIGTFATKEEAENVISYMNTKFFRFMVLLKKSAQNTTKKVYQFVPMEDFSKSWTDKELYAKYDIEEKEQQFIDRLIKEI